MLLVNVKHRLQFLEAMIDVLVEHARISFEGDLSRSRRVLDAIPGATTQPSGALQRHTMPPHLGIEFMIVPLEPTTRDILMRRVLPQIGIRKHVFHVQIEKEGQLQLMAYDNFHPECVTVGPLVSEDLLRLLVEKHILRTYTAIMDV